MLNLILGIVWMAACYGEEVPIDDPTWWFVPGSRHETAFLSKHLTVDITKQQGTQLGAHHGWITVHRRKERCCKPIVGMRLGAPHITQAAIPQEGINMHDRRKTLYRSPNAVSGCYMLISCADLLSRRSNSSRDSSVEAVWSHRYGSRLQNPTATG